MSEAISTASSKLCLKYFPSFLGVRMWDTELLGKILVGIMSVQFTLVSTVVSGKDLENIAHELPLLLLNFLRIQKELGEARCQAEGTLFYSEFSLLLVQRLSLSQSFQPF